MENIKKKFNEIYVLFAGQNSIFRKINDNLCNNKKFNVNELNHHLKKQQFIYINEMYNVHYSRILYSDNDEPTFYCNSIHIHL